MWNCADLSRYTVLERSGAWPLWVRDTLRHITARQQQIAVVSAGEVGALTRVFGDMSDEARPVELEAIAGNDTTRYLVPPDQALRVPPGLYRAQIALPARPSQVSRPSQTAQPSQPAQSTQRTVAVLPAGYESLLSVDGRPPQAAQARPGFAETQGSDIGWWLLVAAALLLLLEQQVASAAGRRYVS